MIVATAIICACSCHDAPPPAPIDPRTFVVVTLQSVTVDQIRAWDDDAEAADYGPTIDYYPVDDWRDAADED